jgi:hypothetical protein
MEFLYYLEPSYNHEKSFYKKAKVYRDNNGTIYLESYNTIVAEIKDEIIEPDVSNRVKVNGWYSRTTARHINDFLYQHGFKTMSKKEMES